MKNMMVAAALAVSLPYAASAAVVDTIDASSGQAGTFFVPTVGQEYDNPYRRGNGEGWSWTHNAIAAGFTSAALNVSAFDVDEAPCGRSRCEVDEIQAYDTATSSWLSVGTLTGDDDAFSFTEFDLFASNGGALVDDVVAGLQVRILIDTLDNGWLVSLAKSVITTDGEDPGPPNPGTVPLPASGWGLIAGMGLLGVMRRRRKAATA